MVVELSDKLVVCLVTRGLVAHQHLSKHPSRGIEVLKEVLLPRAKVHHMTRFLADPHCMYHLRNILPRSSHLLLQVRVVLWTIDFRFLLSTAAWWSEAN